MDCPGAEKLFTYRLPPGLTIQTGDILSVPFGPQTVGGIAIRCFADLPEALATAQIREVVDLVSPSLFPDNYWSLLERVAQYYHAPLMAVIRVALPPGLLMRSQRRIRLSQRSIETQTLTPTAQKLIEVLQNSPNQDYTWTYLQRQVKGANQGLRELRQRGYVESYVQPQSHAQPKRQQVVTLLSSAAPDLTSRQQEVLVVLQQQGGEMWLQPFTELCHTTPKTLKTLEEKGCVAITLQERLRLEQSPFESDQAQTLTPDQEQALAVIQDLQGYHQVLLHGVTGSGKTEVYLQAIAPTLKRGQSVLVLVPEIGLTPQLTDRFRARFGDRVCVYHSALSDGERYDTWRQMLTETAQVVIGTRSAIFSPLPNLGMVILDEEHDTGYKQDRPAPCYHARTVARWRAEAEDCPLILGSATPSLESWATSQHLLPHTKSEPSNHHYLSLPQRVHARPMPPISIVDMRQELEQGNRSLFSRKLQAGLQQLHSGQQGLLFIHRRGHSTFVSCRSCGYVVECPHCSVSLTYHHNADIKQPLLRCHYCNFTQTQPAQCPDCSSPYFRFFGSGTQRVIEDLNRQFPDLRVLRFDSDTTRRKGAHRQLLDRFAAGEADLMVGTQMLTKGIDLPQVRFVGVLAADSLLNLPDFRASERTFQTLLQVAGRAGRGEHPGQVIMQTYNPDHPVIQAVQRYAYETTVDSELQQRAALQYPPYGQLIVLRLSSPSEERVEQTAQAIATYLVKQIEALGLEAAVLGPAPANILRVARRYRWQVLLKLPAIVDGMPAWTLPTSELQARCPKDVRLAIDVDPLTLL
ncbi:Primosomal protein N' [Acaryochloris thomasi RCC1774]|uniref:Replication restart protein PriA n=1 Tax=Acaryochloris thomasi RCC1774 TaxID=1764569 RepID=A0A2W1JXD2_9CYAN|nr:Primosomal protein N' [Acaryochloris thomasi RCC1774]